MFVDLVGEEDMKARKGEGEMRTWVNSKSNTKEAEKVVRGSVVGHDGSNVRPWW